MALREALSSVTEPLGKSSEEFSCLVDHCLALRHRERTLLDSSDRFLTYLFYLVDSVGHGVDQNAEMDGEMALASSCVGDWMQE